MSDLDQATHLLHRVGQCAADMFTRMTNGVLTSRQFIIMTGIESNEGLSQSDLVEATGIDRSTLAEVIKRLVDRQLVERKRREGDRRAYELRLSRAGKHLLRKTRPYADAVNRRIEDAIPNQALVLKSLTTMVGRLTEEARNDVR